MKTKDVRVDTRLVGEGGPQEMALEQPEGEDALFTIAVIGDFGSRADGAVDLTAARRWRTVDVDNFETVLGKLDVRWTPASGDRGRSELTIRSIDDFAPETVVVEWS